MASPSNNRNRGARPTGGKGGGRAGKPNKPVAGTKDKTVRVPSSWNAQVVDPTNNRGAGQRPTGGQGGGRAGRPSGSIARPPKPPTTTAKPTAATTAAAKSKLLGKGAVGTAVLGAILNAPEEIRKGARLARDPKGAVSDVVKGLGFTEGFLSQFDKKGGTSKGDERTNRPGGRGRTTSDATPTRPGTPSGAGSRRGAAPVPGGGGSKPKKPSLSAIDYEKLFIPEGGRGNYGLDRKPQPVAPLPPSVRRSSNGGSGSSTPSRGGTTQRKGSSSPSAASSSSTSGSPAKPGQKWNDFNPNRGTSKTNNPLMKDLVGRIKDREDRDQSSKASKLTSKFNTESYFSGEKVDGSKVDTKAKINSTTSEYDKKKRRYGG
jgi:hypothetical protein